MSVVNYPNTSPYAETGQTSWYLQNWVYRDIPPDGGDNTYVLLTRHQYRPDTLSYELYATPAYWWVFAIRNPFLRSDPLWSFTSGTAIIVPSASLIQSVFGN